MSTWREQAARRLVRLAGKLTDAGIVPDGFAPMTSLAAEDIVIVGYPKSGNTWFQDLVSGVVFGVMPELAPAGLVQDLVPDVHARSFYQRYATPSFFKSHHLPRPEYRRVVYLLRDGRDVMVSYFHHLSALKRQAVTFAEMVREGKGLFPCKWHQHVEAWLANPHAAAMITIRYEDLKDNPGRELGRFCEFAGVKRAAEFVQRVADGTAFEKMQSKEIALGLGDPQWPKDKLFRRRGAVGSYQDEMPADILAAFLADAGAVLRRCGYVTRP